MSRLSDRLSFSAVTAVLAIGLVSCGNTNVSSSVDASDEAEYGGTLVFLESQVPTCFYAGGSGFYPVASILNQLSDKLTYQDPDTREITPWLATEWDINEDSTEYTFTLRDDVTFSDGTALDAETVALNFDNFGSGNSDLGLASQEFISNYESSEVIDENTVRFHFSAPSPGFLQATSVVGAAIVSQETAQLAYEDQCQLENFVGTGPFTVSDVVPEQEYTLEVREDYDWAPEVSEHQGRAYLDEIQIVVTPEANVRTGALSAQQAHVIRDVQAYDFEDLEASGASVHLAPTNGVNPQLALRPGHPFLADERVRHALQLATDTETAVETIYEGRFQVATSPLSEAATGYIDLSDELEYDPDQAARLLDEAGWEKGADGFRYQDGQRLELTTWVGDVFPLNQQLDELIAQQWEDVGVALDIERPDEATRAAGNLDPLQLPVAITHVGRVDPEVLYSNFHSASGRNALVSEDDDLDDLLDQISYLANEDERYEVAAEVQRYLLEAGYTIPLYELPQTYATAPNVEGISWEAVGRVTLYDTWIQQ